MEDLLDTCDKLRRHDPSTEWLEWENVTMDDLLLLDSAGLELIATALDPNSLSPFLKELSVDASAVDPYVLGLLGTAVATSNNLASLNLKLGGDFDLETDGAYQPVVVDSLFTAATRSSSIQNVQLENLPFAHLRMTKYFFERVSFKYLTIDATDEPIPADLVDSVCSGLEGQTSIELLELSQVPPSMADRLLVNVRHSPLEELNLYLRDSSDTPTEFGSLLSRHEFGQEIKFLEIGVDLGSCDLSPFCRFLAKGSWSIHQMILFHQSDGGPLLNRGNERFGLGWKAMLKSDKLKLKKLIIDGNGFSGNLVDSMAGGLAESTSLRSVTITGFSSVQEGIFAGILERNKSLVELQLRDCQLSSRHAQSLAQGLMSNTTLETLSLDRNAIAGTGLLVLAEGLDLNTTLQKLCLSGNHIEGPDAHRALRRILMHNKGIRFLDLSRNNVIGDVGGELVADGLANNSTLEELGLARNKLCQESARHLLPALARNQTLRTLSLSDVGFPGTVCAPQLMELLQSTKLESLDLSGNPLVKVDIEMLARGVHINETLRKLDLSSVGLDGPKLLGLAEVIGENASLEYIDVGILYGARVPRNEFDRSSVQAFLRMIPRMRRLREIHGIRIEDEETAVLLVESLQQHSVLRRFSGLEYLPASSVAKKQALFYMELNHRGRQLLRPNDDGFKAPLALWPHVLSKVSAPKDARFLYYLICNKTELVTHELDKAARPAKKQKLTA